MGEVIRSDWCGVTYRGESILGITYYTYKKSLNRWVAMADEEDIEVGDLSWFKDKKKPKHSASLSVNDEMTLDDILGKY